MHKIDLITGFLGSGKTTFIRYYAKYLWQQGERVCILENDYGAINVDRLLLTDLCQDGLDVEMVAGGVDYDCHKRRLKTKLITLAMLGYTRVIMEPSGIFDIDEFFDLLCEEPLDQQYEVANVITVTRADLEPDLSEQAEYLLGSQAAQAGCMVLSHVQECDEKMILATVEHVNHALEQIKCDRRYAIEQESLNINADILGKDWKALTEEDFEMLRCAGYRKTSFEKTFSMDQSSFQTLFFMNLEMNQKEMRDKIRQIFQDASAGNIIRVKGFAKVDEDISEGAFASGWYEINATRDNIQIEPIAAGQDVIIVIGEHLAEEIIEKYFPARYSTRQTV